MPMWNTKVSDRKQKVLWTSVEKRTQRWIPKAAYKSLKLSIISLVQSISMVWKSTSKSVKYFVMINILSTTLTTNIKQGRQESYKQASGYRRPKAVQSCIHCKEDRSDTEKKMLWRLTLTLKDTRHINRGSKMF